MPTHPYPTPDADPWTDITQYIDLLIAAVDYELDRPDVWPDGEADEGQGYMEDLKAWLQELSNTMFTPIGSVIDYAGTTAPDGWLLCDGDSHLKADYPELWGVLSLSGTVYQIDSTHFKTPDLRGRVVVGAGTGSSLTERTIGETDGEEAHTLTWNEMPSHNHQLAAKGDASAFGSESLGAVPGETDIPDFESVEAGGNQPHNNMQPFHVLNKIIRAK